MKYNDVVICLGKLLVALSFSSKKVPTISFCLQLEASFSNMHGSRGKSKK